MNIISIHDKSNYDIRKVGNKADSLMMLYQNGFLVPAGIVLTTDYIGTLLNHNDVRKKIEHLLNQILSNKFYMRRNLSLIRKIIENIEVPDCFINEIHSQLVKNGIDLDKGVSVRSSSPNEDANNQSFAGVYSSFINVFDTKTLINSVLKVYSSAYSEVAFSFGSNNYQMAIIIQQMERADNYGVAFTNMSTAPGYICIETSKCVTGIVDNKSTIKRLYLNRTVLDNYYGVTDISDLHAFGRWILDIEYIKNQFCDIEFAFTRNRFVLLQCRPISTYKQICDFAFFNQDDTATCDKYYLGNCNMLYNRYLGKQKYLRDAIQKCGFNTYKQYYLICKTNPLDENRICDAIDFFFEECDSFILEFSQKKDSIFCKRSQIIAKLRNYIENSALDWLYVRVGEVIVADYSGYASVTGSGDLFIEYVPGRLNGLAEGKYEGAKLLITDSAVNYINNPYLQFVDTIDDQSGKKISIPYEKIIPRLSSDELHQVKTFTVKMLRFCNNARLEWYMKNGKLYGKDVSIEESDISSTSCLENIISAGEITGEAFIIPDIDRFDDISYKYEISLYGHSKENYKMSSDEFINDVISNLMKLSSPIIIAERPSSGLLTIIDMFAGAIFERGAILSHIGIAMREKKIPAIISNDIFRDNRIKNGTRVKLSEGSYSLFQ